MNNWRKLIGKKLKIKNLIKLNCIMYYNISILIHYKKKIFGFSFFVFKISKF